MSSRVQKISFEAKEHGGHLVKENNTNCQAAQSHSRLALKCINTGRRNASLRRRSFLYFFFFKVSQGQTAIIYVNESQESEKKKTSLQDKDEKRRSVFDKSILSRALFLDSAVESYIIVHTLTVQKVHELLSEVQLTAIFASYVPIIVK